jgi:uncharacterized protein involved in exopolysaccharide biosynthesis
MDLGALFELLWSRHWLISACVVVCVGLAGAAAFLMTPVYRAATVLVPAEVERSGVGSLAGGLGDLAGLSALVGVDIGSGSRATDEALAVLRSREFTEGFIRDRGLMPLLFRQQWDAEAQRWRGDADDEPTMAEGFKYFNERLRSVSQDTRTGLVTVRIDWRDPNQAADWANQLVARLNAEMRARAIARTKASVGFLEQELASTVIVDTRSAISRLMESQINQRMLANVTEEYAFRVVDKALPPDEDDPVRPRKLMMLVTGAAIGLLFGVVWVGGGCRV